MQSNCTATRGAYFVRKDRLGFLKAVTVEAGYVRSKFRESRDINGQLTFLRGDERLRMIQDMPIYDIERNATVSIKALFKR